ncbi:hypothetical protein DFH11DRAFT_78477 [Phellopilus nigrolimitatus]|nr:hypothetical protein DFH11DRAFT_78477 [Phellopilus nigrolimitatus]
MDAVGTAKAALVTTGRMFLELFVPEMALYFKPLVSFLQGMRKVLFPPESRSYPVPDEYMPPEERSSEDVFASFKAEFDKCLISLRQKPLPQAPSVPNVFAGGSTNRQTVRDGLPYILKTHLRTANDAAKTAVRVASKKSGGFSRTFDKAGHTVRMLASQTAPNTAADSNTASKVLDTGSHVKNKTEAGNSVETSSSRKRRATSPDVNMSSELKRAKKDNFHIGQHMGK